MPGVRQEEWPEGAAMCLVTPRASSMSGVPAGLEVHHSHGALDSTLDSLGEVHHRGKGTAVEVESDPSGNLVKIVMSVKLVWLVRMV